MSRPRLDPDAGHLMLTAIAPISADRMFAGDGDYTELVWVCLLGPTATLIYRRLVRMLGDTRGPVSLDLDDLARSFGIRRNVALRSLQRLVEFRFASVDERVLAVCLRVPPIPTRCLERLSPAVRQYHLSAMHQARSGG